MMQLTHSLGAKIAAILLFVVLLFGVLTGVGVTLMMYNSGYYWQEADEIYNHAVEQYLDVDKDEVQALYRQRSIIPILTAIGFLLCVALFLFLLCAAGHRVGHEAATLNLQDKIPLDLYLAAVCVLLMGMVENTYLFDWSIPESIGGAGIWEIMLWAFVLVVMALLGLAVAMTLATRVKTRTFWRNTVVYRVLHLCWRAVCWVGRGVRTLYRNIPLLWKSILIYAVYSLIMLLVCRETDYSSMAVLLWMGISMMVLLALCFFVLQMSRLMEGAKRIAEGDLSYHVPTEHMFFELKRHGENLNSIGVGMTHAVEERLRSERLKTELITNVSHDIKTPLTSILNYVDLLKKETVLDDTATEYVAVVDRQAHRLKKLTEDVLEASKAATGNIKVELARTDAVELLGQCLAEYEERFREASLSAVIQTPGEPAFILADGRLLWRVFDNLMGNIAKYAQPGTRVYASVRRAGGLVIIALKNVSRDALNVTEAELMERFVRGDSARTSEGSGLGLSIARSLTELQGGSFALGIECDLFMAELRFAAVPDEA